MIKIKSYASGSSGNLYLASNGNYNILLECGVDENIIINMLNKNKMQYKDVNCVFTSHCHQDHSKNIKLFQDYMIPCYCTYETKMRYLLEDNEYFIPLQNDKIYKIGSGNDMIQVLSFSVNHGNVECFGFVLVDKDSCILFITDFMECLKPLKFDFTQVFIECNYISSLLEENLNKCNSSNYLQTKYQRQFNTHMSLDNLIKTINKKINIKKCNAINLIHISKDVGNYDIMKNTIEEEFGIPTYCIMRNGERY